MSTYIHELPGWPGLHWNRDALGASLGFTRFMQGHLVGHMQGLGFGVKEEAELQTLTQDVLKTSEIEGEILDAEQVRSSIARHLGLDAGGLKPIDRAVEGIVEMTLDATRGYDRPLTEERLFSWHAALFPSGRTGVRRITVGAWRTEESGAMQVVSGSLGREQVHFEAPAAARVPGEMRRFLDWFNGETIIDVVCKAALAHLWFATIHPFADGNGRIARAIADMALARSERTARRFYSMSAQIRQERRDYYAILERTQHGTMDVTPWMEWFLGCLGRAIDGAYVSLDGVMAKARFWEAIHDVPLNDRQQRIINRLLQGFEGKLTTVKWATLAKCSPDTALRDIQYLVDRGVLTCSAAGGRSTSYALVVVPPRT